MTRINSHQVIQMLDDERLVFVDDNTGVEVVMPIARAKAIIDRVTAAAKPGIVYTATRRNADELAGVVAGVARDEGVAEGSRWVHVSGGHGTEVLRPVRLAGAAVALLLRPTVSPDQSRYLAMAVVAAIDSSFGGLRAHLEQTFSDRLFVLAFVTNAAVAVLLVWKSAHDLEHVKNILSGSSLYVNDAQLATRCADSNLPARCRRSERWPGRASR